MITAFPAPTKKSSVDFSEWSGIIEVSASPHPLLSPHALTNLLSLSKNFKWNPECQQAFVNMTDLLCTAPVLAAPNFEVPLKIEEDASDFFWCRRSDVTGGCGWS